MKYRTGQPVFRTVYITADSCGNREQRRAARKLSDAERPEVTTPEYRRTLAHYGWSETLPSDWPVFYRGDSNDR